MSFSHFSEHWLAGVTAAALLPGLAICDLYHAPGPTMLQQHAAAAVGIGNWGRRPASRKAVWWDLRLASLLTHSFD